MTDDDLQRLVRKTFASTGPGRAHRDLWPDVLRRIDQRQRWLWIDVGLAAAVVVVLTLFPEWLPLLAYHL